MRPKLTTLLEDPEIRSLVERADASGMLDPDPLKTWCPHAPTPKQAEFLALHEFEALFGGAAGGGKSDALLMGALQHVSEPTYAALVLRRSYADLSLPGAIMDRAHEWLSGTKASWNGMEKTWTFPSGARITFGYLDTDKDKYRYQSSEFQYIAFDELTQFPEASYRYLLSRVRRQSGSDLPLRVRTASNPGGIGHQWVHDRFVDTHSDRMFVPSLLTDNPHIDADEYRKSLAQLDETTRRQLENGEWIQDTRSLVYKYDRRRNFCTTLPEGDWAYVLGVDFGASQIQATTAFATWAFDKDNPIAYLVEATRHAGLIVSSIAEHVRALNEKYDYQRMVADQGALGKGYIEELRRRHTLPVNPCQKKDKLGYRKLFNGELENARIQVLPGAEEWIDEAENLRWSDDGTRSDGGYADHASDAALYGWREAKHFLYKKPPVLPKADTREYYEKEARDYEERLVQRIEERDKRNILGGMFR